MAFESAYERYVAVGRDGQERSVKFQKAGFLNLGDQPELYFFRVEGKEVAVGISGQALVWFQRGRRYLTRAEKIDLAGLLLKQQIEAAAPLEPENLLIRQRELARLAGELGFPE